LTLRQFLTGARERLVAAGIAPAEAAVDVDLYARTILGWDRARLLADHETQAPGHLEPQFSQWMARRERHEPTAYIVGCREFWGLELLVTPAVLIPRPETEFIVEEALKVVSSGTAEAGPHVRIADIGTGSGCVAVALAHELRNATLTATDVSGEALAVAGENARRHGVGGRVTFVQTSYLEGIEGPFQLVVSNPPYVRSGDKPALARGVKHEPDVALFGGSDGLAHLAGVLDAAIPRLEPGGWMVMEFGYGQEDDVRALIEARPALRFDHVRHDLQEIPRTVIMQRR
jgi:release factor glutamine methyltransferase